MNDRDFTQGDYKILELGKSKLEADRLLAKTMGKHLLKKCRVLRFVKKKEWEDLFWGHCLHSNYPRLSGDFEKFTDEEIDFLENNQPFLSKLISMSIIYWTSDKYMPSVSLLQSYRVSHIRCDMNWFRKHKSKIMSIQAVVQVFLDDRNEIEEDVLTQQISEFLEVLIIEYNPPYLQVQKGIGTLLAMQYNYYVNNDSIVIGEQHFEYLKKLQRRVTYGQINDIVIHGYRMQAMHHRHGNRFGKEKFINFLKV